MFDIYRTMHAAFSFRNAEQISQKSDNFENIIFHQKGTIAWLKIQNF